MSLDITPVIPVGRQLIQRYGEGGFRIANVDHDGSVIVFADSTEPWPISGLDQITMESLAAILKDSMKPDILLIGCGPAFAMPPIALRSALKENGIVLEWMDTGAACRTFNVLLAEERSAAAALIAVE